MTSSTTPPGTSPIPTEAQLDWLRLMHEIRFFEEECHRMFAQGIVRGSTHLAQGQEAVAVGACKALRETDTMSCTYRGHGAVIAKGAPLDRSFGEILGKGEGLCGGKGGSMHLTDMSVGAIGSFAIIGAHLPIALGVAHAAQYKGTDDVTLCFFGDGATNIGAFHESLNLAVVWKLPVVFVCENNLYMEYTPIGSVTAVENPAADRAASYGLERILVDGNDADAMYLTARECLSRARSGDGPSLIEARTYRTSGHSRADPGTYKPKDEVAAWAAYDPIVLYRTRLLRHGVSDAALDAIEEAADGDVETATVEAKASPPPGEEMLLRDVWSDGGWSWRN
jgi:acetoin:2,6-dichlorophenolindophenol oxidoreductase subunit alpha